MDDEPCTCSPHCGGYKPQPEEDKLSWCQSVANYVKETRTNKLDLRTVPSHDVFWQHMDVQPLFDSLLDSEIRDINLQGKDLTGQMPKLCEILSKTKIEKLNLASCSFTVDDFTGLLAVLKDTRITELVVSACRLTADEVASLMAVLKDTRITELDISSNRTRLEKPQQVKRFLTHLANSHLKSLNLHSNGILPVEKLPALFQRLPDTKITRLDLSEFFFRCGYSHKKKYPGCLDTLMSNLQHTAITDLNLGSNCFGDDIAKALGPILGKSKLEKLNLSNNKLTDAGVDLLVPGLINSRITYLNLRDNQISGENSLGHSLKNTKIRKLVLTRNEMEKKKMFSGSDFLRGSDVNTISFSWCFFATKTIPLHFKKLKFSELTCLDLAGNKLTLEHVSALADVLSASKLTHLILLGNRFFGECFSVLGDSLIKSQLKYINLSGIVPYNDSEEKRVAGNGSIAAVVENTKGSSIVSMNLSDNYLGEDDDCISPALANTTLLELDLSSNRWKTVDRLAEQLKLTSLAALHLYSNEIDDSGAVALSKYLEETRIVILTLRFNSITNSGVKALAEVLKKTKLRHLDLGSNLIENEGLESLAEHARSTCVTYLNVDCNSGNRTLMVDSVVWENRRKILVFADLLKKTSLFTGDSSLFEFDRNLDGMDTDVFIEDCLNLYKMVVEEPYIIKSIEQDKRIADLNTVKCFEYDTGSFDGFKVVVDVYIEDCAHIYKKVLEQPLPQSTGEQDKHVSFSKQILWLMLEEFPRKFVSFVGRVSAADVEHRVSLLRKAEELKLTRIVELLLLNG